MKINSVYHDEYSRIQVCDFAQKVLRRDAAIEEFGIDFALQSIEECNTSPVVAFQSISDAYDERASVGFR